MNDILKNKLKTLPSSPGVYFHKSKSKEIIYVGKAAVLKNRVRQYFQSQKERDLKTMALIDEIDDTEWIETESEIDALFLESEMIKRYKPRFNILLRDDKSETFIRIDMKSEWPYVSFTHNPVDDKAEYFGPYYNGYAIKKALKYLRKTYPYYIKTPNFNRPDLDTHIGLNPKQDISSKEYKEILKKLIRYIKGERSALLNELEKDMKLAASRFEYELAADLRNKLRNLKELKRRIMFGDREFLNISKDEALFDLESLLNLKKIPSRIEGYDISHMSGSNVVASAVVFTNGVADRSNYRKFKTRVDRNDDFQNMNETITRRLSEKNLKDWGTPDLVLIDGGKGQLDAAIEARDHIGHNKLVFIGLAKREEQIVISRSKSNIELNKDKLKELGGTLTYSEDFILINIPHSSHIIKLLQRIRDESHRFAVSYHTILKRKNQTASELDAIPGIGSKTRSKLIKKFGSLRNVKTAKTDYIIDAIGKSKAKILFEYLQMK